MNETTRYGNAAGRVAAAALALFLASCATTPSPPSAAARAELAGTGKVRMAFVSVPNFVNQPASTPPTGVAPDLGKALADRLGVGFEAMIYPTVTALLADARAGKYDVAVMGFDPARGADYEFTRPYAFTENTYLVPAGSGLMTVADVDRKGVRVTVASRSQQYNFLKANLKQADLGTVERGAEAEAELLAGKTHAYAANRQSLEEMAARMPGHRIVSGSFSDLRYVLAVPKGRSAAVAFADEVVRELLASGAVAESITRAKLKGLNAAK